MCEESMNREQKAIIAIGSLKNVMVIFLGPFLTAYFIKTTSDSLIGLSFYYIITYLILGIATLAVAIIVNNKYRIEMYRIGVINNFIYMLLIVLLQDKIINYLSESEKSSPNSSSKCFIISDKGIPKASAIRHNITILGSICPFSILLTFPGVNSYS